MTTSPDNTGVWWPTDDESWDLAMDIMKAERLGWSFSEWQNYKHGRDYSTPYRPAGVIS